MPLIFPLLFYSNLARIFPSCCLHYVLNAELVDFDACSGCIRMSQTMCIYNGGQCRLSGTTLPRKTQMRLYMADLCTFRNYLAQPLYAARVLWLAWPTPFRWLYQVDFGNIIFPKSRNSRPECYETICTASQKPSLIPSLSFTVTLTCLHQYA